MRRSTIFPREAGRRAVLSVAICTHERSAALTRCLAGLGPGREGVDVLVIDSGSGSAEAAAIERIALAQGAQHFRLPAVGLSGARNAALAAARGDWIAYLDDDAIPAADWLDVLLARIGDPELAAIGGMILPRWQAMLPAWWPPSLRAVLSIIDRVEIDRVEPGDEPEPYAANIAFRREVLARFGGFPACLGRRGRTLLSNEETYILRRLRKAGLKVRFDRDLVVHHDIGPERLQPGWLVERQYWNGVSEAVMLAALGDRRLAKAWCMAGHAALLAPIRWWPRASTRCLALRCRAAFASGFIRGVLGEPDADLAGRAG